ncbi:hypothetical protein [Agarivorans sp. 1_MG-2023]|uniref:hypothetical protein n=1 Tax=Agarivorans sp. 1_MG-2023 TaxID=3062634 RepID=UPI0026E4865A|nr:hypothetical protein [Agarivorans sp. 1_MG-2023]MDO6762362.1 hypothetical protein [Agarivorans sp. 1_MG-2023]
MDFRIFYVFLVFWISFSAYAVGTLKGTSTFDSLSFDAKEVQRFRAYGVNSAVWNFREGDDDALQADYSFLYTIYDCRVRHSSSKEDNTELKSTEGSWSDCGENALVKPLVFVSYTGQFDFYLSTRSSSPVINRLSNPAIHFFNIVDKDKYVNYFDISFEHRSNGQTREIDEFDSSGLKTETAYLSGDYRYFDEISRGSNYFKLAVGNDKSIESISLNWRLSIKAYVTDDTEVNWGEWANSSTSIKDYDIVRASISVSPFIFSGLTFTSSYVFGKELLKNDSFDWSIIYPLEGWGVSIPLMIKGHHGPMATLSNYTKSVSSLGVGFAFYW